MESKRKDIKTQFTYAMDVTEHWNNVALQWQQWRKLGSPLRPTKEDIAFFSEAITVGAGHINPLRVLILGVTPELYHLPWPENTDLLAADISFNMINHVWSGPRGSAICAEWSDLPLQKNSRDIVLCDGGFNLLKYPDGHFRLTESLQRIIAPGGLCIFRLFVPPRKRETVKEVLQDMFEGKIPRLNLLKFRLWMASHTDITQGVQHREVWDKIYEAAPDFKLIAERNGWPIEYLLTINSFKDNPTKNYFVDINEVQKFFCETPGGFELVKLYTPTYEMGECCPTVVFRRLQTGTKGKGS